jgi:hypothetical protein
VFTQLKISAGALVANENVPLTPVWSYKWIIEQLVELQNEAVLCPLSPPVPQLVVLPNLPLVAISTSQLWESDARVILIDLVVPPAATAAL